MLEHYVVVNVHTQSVNAQGLYRIQSLSVTSQLSKLIETNRERAVLLFEHNPLTSLFKKKIKCEREAICRDT